MSRVFQLLTGVAGVLLLGSALVLVGYAVVAREHLSDLGWIVAVAFASTGALALRRAATWNARTTCRRCGEPLSRDERVCPQCGLDLDKTAWATIGTYKLP
jgi:ribosomal protein L37E